MMTSSVPVPRVLQELRKLYTPPRTFLDHTSPFQLLIATILSAQCTDKMVNRITPALFKKYRKPEDFLTVPPEELQRDIHSCGHYRNKAKHIQGSCLMLIEKFGGKVPQTMDELIELPGVGRKTAAVIMYAAYGQQGGIAVDTHVWRVSKRLGLSKAKTQDKIELDLMRQTPKEHWGELHTLLIMHGRAICTARNRQCDQCPFQKDCPSSWTEGREDRGRK
jgi:endonuclease-3